MKVIVRKTNKFRIIFGLLIFSFVAVGIFLVSTNQININELFNLSTQNKNTDGKTTTIPVIQKNTIKIAAMGDMLAHDTIVSNAKTGDTYDFGKYFTNIRPAYQDSDVVYCNQEGLSSGEAYGISGYPSFNAPTQFSLGLQSGAGCNLINLANNHIGDKGISAINATIDVWSNLKPLGVSGVNKNTDDQNKVSFAEVKGMKIGYVAFTDFNNNTSIPSYSVNLYRDEVLLRKLVAEARAKSDVVIVSMHWGVEDSSVVSEDQYNNAKLLNSLGADVIIGTGPHVLQKVETLTREDGHKTVVWYSLGNMLSSQLYINQLIGGIAEFNISKNDGKISVTDLTFTPTYMHYDWTASEASSFNLGARKNAMLYLLSDSETPLSKSYFNTTVAAQKQYVINTLGSEVNVK